MMKNKISSPYRKLKLLLILPVAAFVLYAFAVPEYRIANGPEGSVSPVVASVSKQVKGVILNEEGVPLEGATIVIKGSTTGTSSDNHGKFSLKDVPEDGVLVISYVGYETALFTVSGKTEISVRMKKKDVVMETVKVTPGPPPPPPPPPPSKSAWNVEGDPLIIVDGFKSDKDLSGISPDDIQSVTVLKGERATEKYGDAGKEGVVEVTMKKHAAKDDVTSEKNDGRVKVTMKKKPEVSNDKDDDEVFVVVEDMPLFPEGNEAIMQWINGKIKYPEEAIAQKISGRVVVGFTISASGKVTDVKVAKSVHPLLDAEAIRVIKSMPDWKPGTQHGKPVDVRYMIPVEFNLNATGGEKVVR